MSFLDRVGDLPVLGLGVSTEYGAADSPHALDLLGLRARYPRYAAFLEIGIETAKGLDRHALAWCAQRWPTTYHFLDVNFDEPEDLGQDWLDEIRSLVERTEPAWLCGDAGLWHFGPRDRGHMLLLPPILTDAHAQELARGIAVLREATGREVIPENPPGTVFVGDLSVPAFFARLALHADTGLLIDVAHLAISQRMTGRQPLDGLDDLPYDRIVEIHVAGGVPREHAGFAWVEDDHGTDVLADTWQIFAHIAERADNLKAVVLECERNPVDAVVPLFRQIDAVLATTPLGRALTEVRP